MSDFQSYLDKALKNIDINNSTNEPLNTQEDYDISHDISALLFTVRKEVGLSQKELSKRTGIPQANISKIENGKYLPSLPILKRLADGLNRRLIIDFIDMDMMEEE